MKFFKQFINELREPTNKIKEACWKGYTAAGTKQKGGRTVPNCVPVKEDHVKELFDIIEEMVEATAAEYNIDSELLWEKLESVSDEDLIEESAAWQRSAGKDPKGGLNRKGIASYRKEHPGSKLSMAVTTPPSKLKAGSKSANRRKSFCARMSGMKSKLTSAKTARDPDSRINKSLRKWNC